MLPCFSGLAVVFAEDVPDVPKEDITTSAYNFSKQVQELNSMLY